MAGTRALRLVLNLPLGVFERHGLAADARLAGEAPLRVEVVVDLVPRSVVVRARDVEAASLEAVVGFGD